MEIRTLSRRSHSLSEVAQFRDKPPFHVDRHAFRHVRSGIAKPERDLTGIGFSVVTVATASVPWGLLARRRFYAVSPRRLNVRRENANGPTVVVPRRRAFVIRTFQVYGYRRRSHTSGDATRARVYVGNYRYTRDDFRPRK